MYPTLPLRRSERKSRSKRPLRLRDFVFEESEGEPEAKSLKLSENISPESDTDSRNQMALEEVKSLLEIISTDQKEATEQISLSQNQLYTQVEESRTEMKNGVAALKQLMLELGVEVKNNTAAISALQTQVRCSSSNLNSLRNSQEHTSRTVFNGNDNQSNSSSSTSPTPPISTSVEAITRQISQSITTALGSNRKLIQLPKFNGEVEKWPQFIAQFNRTTERECYTTEDNATRLQQALEGKALDLVASLLIHHTNVPRIIKRLKTRFGDPEQLVTSQLAEIRKVDPIPDDKLHLIVPFADQVVNLRYFLESADCIDHLNSPTLLKELEGKLPYRERIAWAGYSLSLRPPTVIGFSDWIEILADQIHRVSSKEIDVKKKKARVFHLSSDYDDTCIVCEDEHNLAECEKFLKMSCSERWKSIQNNNMCFGCLKQGHQVFQCRDNNRCGVGSCNSKHHKLLHDPTSKEPSYTVPLSESLLSFETESIKVLFKILPVRLYGPTGFFDTFAFFDEGSSITLVNKEVANRIGAHGPSSKLHLRWFGNKESEEDVIITDMHISGAFSKAKQYQLRRVHVVNDLKLPAQTLSLDSLSEKFRGMKKLPIQSFENATPTILIGLDNAHLAVARNKQWNNDDGPIVCLTRLGYVVYGPTGTPESSPGTANLFFAEVDNNKTDENLHSMVKAYFSTEDFGVKSLPVIDSKENIKATNTLESVTVKVGNRYQSGLLWRQEKINLPDNFQMAKKRWESCEKKMRKDLIYATAYHKTMADYFLKGYAKKLTSSEISHPIGPVWYLPHFGVMNPNKPKLRLVFDAAAVFKGISLNSLLLSGPDINQSLIKVLSLFREKEYGIGADIREMYHQVLIRSEDKDAQRFLYRESPTDPLQICRMEVMTFGSTCSPVTAQFVKNRNANLYLEDCPLAVKAIVENHYVDDFVCSFF